MSNTEEQLYPLLLPDDEEGLEWHLVEMTKEEAVATLEANSMRNDHISELILDYNREYITELGADAVKFSEASFDEKVGADLSYAISYFLSIVIVCLFLICFVSTGIAYVVNKVLY